MSLIAVLLVLLVALEHAGLLVLELFLWTHPLSLRLFGLTAEAAEASLGTARNEGLINGFIAVALLSTFTVRDPARRRNLRILLLIVTVVVAAFGGITERPLLFIALGGPAIVAFVFVRFADEWAGRA